MIGQTIAHYEVLDQLGEGGMSVVYKARDTKLDRHVVLKFLPQELSRDEEANERFMQEAKAASALNHENVCVVYDIKETEDGRLYIVMPLYDGDTLKYRLEGGPVDRVQAVDIVRQIASGLAAAHAKWITHRDIKPANIMVTESGRVIILDFGLAKLTGGLDLTKTGSTVGTAFYMSPEQVRGEGVDERTDLWSLGVVFYQLLTGKHPFEGDYEQAVSYAILNHDPLAETDLSERLTEILRRLLSKDLQGRFGSAGEVIEALSTVSSDSTQRQPAEPRKSFLLGKRALVGVAVLALAAVIAVLQPWKTGGPDRRPGLSADRHTIAILPFTNLRSDPDSDYLGYAMANQVIGSLSYVNTLNVRPASSVRRYQNVQFDARQVGDDLAVNYVVAGNYLKQDERMRLTVELVDVETDEIVWTEPIEVRSDDVFEMQDIVARTVLNRLEVSFSEVERSRMQTDVSQNPLAYEYYLRAISHPRTIEGNGLAIELLEQSLRLDSTYAPSWSELGFRKHAVGMFGMSGEEMSRSSEAAFSKALALNPDLLTALADLSTYYTDAGSTDEAFESAQRVIELNPNNAMGHFSKGYALRYAGMMDVAEREMRRAIELDSTNTRFRSAGITFMVNEKYEDALWAFAIDKPSPYYYSFTAEALLRQGQVDEAIPMFRQAEKLDPDGLQGLKSTAHLASISGDHATGIAAARIIEDASLVDAELTYYNATYYCINGDIDACNRNLRRAVEEGYFNYPNLQRTVFLDAARGTPEFEETLELAREKHERFRAKYFGEEGR